MSRTRAGARIGDGVRPRHQRGEDEEEKAAGEQREPRPAPPPHAEKLLRAPARREEERRRGPPELLRPEEEEEEQRHGPHEVDPRVERAEAEAPAVHGALRKNVSARTSARIRSAMPRRSGSANRSR